MPVGRDMRMTGIYYLMHKVPRPGLLTHLEELETKELINLGGAGGKNLID